jgi:hypothetical protein
LDQEVKTVFLWRDIWRPLGTALDTNPDLRRTLAASYMAATYTASQAVAVRRLAVDPKNNVVSFARLLTGIASAPRLISRDWWLSHQDDSLLSQVEGPRDWQQFGGGAYLNAAVPRSDLRELEARVKPLDDYVNKYLAHHAEEQPSQVPSMADLDSALDRLGELLVKYVLLLHGADRGLIAPVVPGDVMAPFRVAWLPLVKTTNEPLHPS